MWLGGYIMIIRLEQVLDAIETADDAFTYFFDTQTGETVFLSDPMITGESYEELEELIESSGDRFLRFPTKYDIHEYSIMENFVYSLPAGAARQELANAICDRLEQQWYDYRDQAYREIAIRWCRDEGLEYTEEN